MTTHTMTGHANAAIGETGPPDYFDVLQTALEELLIERRLIRPGEIRHQVDVLDSRTPALGAKVVARAWIDADFRARLLADGRGTCEELGITFYDDTASSCWRTRRPSTTSWSAPRAPATHVRRWACRLIGTS